MNRTTISAAFPLIRSCAGLMRDEAMKMPTTGGEALIQAGRIEEGSRQITESIAILSASFGPSLQRTLDAVNPLQSAPTETKTQAPNGLTVSPGPTGPVVTSSAQ